MAMRRAAGAVSVRCSALTAGGKPLWYWTKVKQRVRRAMARERRISGCASALRSKPLGLLRLSSETWGGVGVGSRGGEAIEFAKEKVKEKRGKGCEQSLDRRQ
jgi:hypothetical protein